MSAKPQKTNPKRRAYMRDFMRRKRAKGRAAIEKNGAVVPVVDRGAVEVPAAFPECAAFLPADPAGALAAWAELRLLVPSGPMRGRPFVLDGWQVDFLRDALAPGIKMAGLSVSRKNGKSGAISALILAYLCGPLNRPDFRLNVVSLTGELSKELKTAVIDLARISGIECKPASQRGAASAGLTTYRTPTPGKIEGQGQGTEARFLAADKSTGHAIGSDVALVDEAGLLPEASRDLWAAMLESTGGRDGRLIAISIRGNGPMFREMFEARGDPALAWHEYAADVDADLLDVAQWHKANPGLKSGIKSIEHLEKTARLALANPNSQSLFRARELNIPGESGKEKLCSVSDWTACQVQALPPREGPCFVGIDVGGSVSMSAVVAYWPKTGRIEAWSALPKIPTLAEKGKGDGVGERYVRMFERGELLIFGERVTDTEALFKHVMERLEGVQIDAAAADRYKQAETLEHLETSGFPVGVIQWRPVGRGPDGSADVRAFQAEVRKRELSVAVSLAWKSAISESDISHDPNGNPGLDKSRRRSRIDILQAGILAVGLGARYYRALDLADETEPINDHVPLSAL